jgi:hypothetical protein
MTQSIGSQGLAGPVKGGSGAFLVEEIGVVEQLGGGLLPLGSDQGQRSIEVFEQL